jgi:hypothetical protein
MKKNRATGNSEIGPEKKAHSRVRMEAQFTDALNQPVPQSIRRLVDQIREIENQKKKSAKSALGVSAVSKRRG